MKIDSSELSSIRAIGEESTGPAESQGIGIAIRRLFKSYGDREVLHGLDVDIHPGEFVSIVGRSGCGKSTLLRLLAGLEEITSGSIEFNGKPGAGDRHDARIMFQDARLLPWRTVIENVAIGLSGAKRDIRERAQEALNQVGLADRGGDWPSRLSGGQRQRVALARALIHRPRLLLLDEPLGALDALTRLEMQRLIERLWQAHAFTAILVTHDVAEAVTLGDRILLVEEGIVTCDEHTRLPRPREHGDADFAAQESRILKRLMTPSVHNVRNQTRGEIIGIDVDQPLSEVRIRTAGGIVTATVSSRQLSEIPLELGAEVLAHFKSNEVIIASNAPVA